MRYTVQSDQTWKLNIILQDSLLAQVPSSWCCGDHSSPTTMTSKSRFEPKVQGESALIQPLLLGVELKLKSSG